MQKGTKMARNLLGWVLALALFVALPANGERVVLEGIMIRVNDQVVTISEFTERVRQESSQFPEDFTAEQLQEFTRNLLTELVAELIMTERASEKKVIADEATVDRAIESIREENNLTDDAAWEQALASSGITEEQLRDRYRKNILLQRTVQGEVRPVEITEEELRATYEEHKDRYRIPARVELEQVFLADETEGDGSSTAIARGLVNRVRGGADLKAEATLAGAELQDLGAIPLEDCRPDLRAAIEGLDDGEVTDPLIVPGGIQVIRLVRRVSAGYEPFEDVVEQLRRERSAESYEEQTRGLVDKLRSEYLVEVHEEHLPLVYQSLGLSEVAGG
jgi:peptidyl-prolyl cis-trans isomerase SurA